VLRRELLAALALLPFGAHAADEAALITRVRQHLVDAPVQRGEFEQRKTVKGFKHALVSRGDYLVSRERGVVWRTREPFASTLIVTRERLLTRQADGTVANRVETRDEPALRMVNELLFALMAADLQALSQRFRLDGEVQASGWQLVLVPRDAALARWVARIELEGERHVRSVKLHEAQGDASVIRFSQQTTAQALTRDEEARFE
jgi:hypothetical protein